MKKLIYHISMAVALLLLGACSQDDGIIPVEPSWDNNLLRLSVSAGDFSLDDTEKTRVSDQGNDLTFEEGDVVGFIIVSGNTIVCNNLPYKYDGANWTYDMNLGGSNKQAVQTNQIVTGSKCIVYYPYQATADNVTSIEDLKAKFVPLADQSSEEAYRFSDLLISEPEISMDNQKSITARLAHAYASVSYDYGNKIMKLDDGEDTEVTIVGEVPENLILGFDNKVGIPYQVDDSYRYVINPSATAVKIHFTCSVGGEYSTKSISFAKVEPNTRYLLVKPNDIPETYSFDYAKFGDYFCKRTDGHGYLIPAGFTLSDAQKEACLGVVLKAGRDTDGTWIDDCEYKLADGVTAMEKVHGYVLALQDAAAGAKVDWANFNDSFVGTQTEKVVGFYGYRETSVIKAYVTAKEAALATVFPATYYATVAYEESYPAAMNGSGWFLPSAAQCQYWYNHLKEIEDIIVGVGGSSTGPTEGAGSGKWYYSSSEDSSDSKKVWRLSQWDKCVKNNREKNGEYGGAWVRPLLAF